MGCISGWAMDEAIIIILDTIKHLSSHSTMCMDPNSYQIDILSDSFILACTSRKIYFFH